MLGSIIIVTELVGILMYQVSGFCFDFLGRKMVITVSTLLGSFSIALMPYCGGVWPWLVITRMLASITSVAILSNPLLVDYVS